MKKKIESIKNAKFNECEAIMGGGIRPQSQTFSVETFATSDYIITVIYTSYHSGCCIDAVI